MWQAGASAGCKSRWAGPATTRGPEGAIGAPGKSPVPFQTLQCSSVQITSTNYAFRELVPDATLYDFPRPFQALQCNLPMCIMSLQDSYHCFFKRGISSSVRGSLHFTLSAKCLAVSRRVTNISSPSSLAVFGRKSSSSTTSSTVTVPLRVDVGGFPFVDRDCCASERSHSFFL